MMTGKIFEIKRFAVHDGGGIRTTVFMKGCPLRCIWCHNPEGISFEPELQYAKNRCVQCGLCAKVCINKAHIFRENSHTIDRSRCTKCGKCADVCITGALSRCFREISSKELLEILLEDKEFYFQSNGGVTFSGGECLCQADFCAEVMKMLKGYNIHCAIDTCGCVNKSEIDKVMKYTDLFLYDIKHIEERQHIRYTGKSNTVILENLKYINDCGKDIEIRIPLITGINDGVIGEIGKFLGNLNMVKRVKLLPYNNLAGSKYSNIGRKNTMPDVPVPSRRTLSELSDILKKYGLETVIG